MEAMLYGVCWLGLVFACGFYEFWMDLKEVSELMVFSVLILRIVLNPLRVITRDGHQSGCQQVADER